MTLIACVAILRSGASTISSEDCMLAVVNTQPPAASEAALENDVGRRRWQARRP